MKDLIIVAVLAVILVAAISYIVKAKRKGVKCIGCPEGCACGKESGGCGGGCGSEMK